LTAKWRNADRADIEKKIPACTASAALRETARRGLPAGRNWIPGQNFAGIQTIAPVLRKPHYGGRHRHEIAQ
jgi:hypothetical protein